jgi:putative flippase GtrA
MKHTYLKSHYTLRGRLSKIITASVIEFLKYGVVGGAAAVANIGVFMTFKEIFLFHYILSNCMGFIAGLFINYSLSKFFVFKNTFRFNKINEFLCYCLIGVIGLGFDIVLIWFFIEKSGVNYLLSKIISTIIVFWWNFLSKKYINISHLLSVNTDNSQRLKEDAYGRQ